MATATKQQTNKELLKKLKLTLDEYSRIVELIGRDPNEVELHMFSVMWSEHCCYKNSKILLKEFPTKNKYVVVGPGENAGVVDLGDGTRIAFKIESHNRPTAVEPFQGAATGIGGILRDIFTMGARPIAILDSLRFGDIEKARSRFLFSGAVNGISHYGNCTGIPNIGGEAYFYPTYNENPLVNAMAVGLIESGKEIIKSSASGIGNLVLYVGSKTGRDGLGGASFASSGLTEKSHEDRPAVQVGDPFCEKVLIEACLEAFKTTYIVSAQDMGAAGLTCSISEMAAKGNVGIDVDLNKVPTRTDLSPVEYMLSESQERMLFVVNKEFKKTISDIFTKWGLDSVQIGEITDTKKVIVRQNGKIIVDILASALVNDTPVYKREAKVPEYYKQNQIINLDLIPDLKQEEVLPTLKKLLASPNICSKKWIYSKYDHEVQINTVIKPGSSAGVIRLKKNLGETRLIASQQQPEKGLAVSLDGNSAYVYLDPYLGSKIAVAEAARNVSCTGALPIAITDNLNFGNPEKPEIYWQLSESVKGIKEACIEFDTPVTGGNVSLYNERNGIDIWPTPVIGMVGLIEDVTLTTSHSFKKAGDFIVLLGEQKNEIGASEYIYEYTKEIKGKVPELDFKLEKKVQLTVRELITNRLINSANDCSIGGLLVTLCKCAFQHELGFELQATSHKPQARLDSLLFGETQSRIIISLDENRLKSVEKHLKEINCPYKILGKVTNGDIKVAPKIKVNIKELKDIWENAFKNYGL